MHPDDYDEWAMARSGERAERRRRVMVGLLLVAIVGTVVFPLIQVFT
ncbi:MAG: hypothetical protein GX643_06190 [Acidimicrobiales bacterium]|nr:hypothetical protein [Acidimicrobiales bacterium]